MSDLEKLKFPALDVAWSNYIVWALEANNYLCADGLGETVEEAFVLPTGGSQQDQAKRKNASRAACLLLRHLHPDLSRREEPCCDLEELAIALRYRPQANNATLGE